MPHGSNAGRCGPYTSPSPWSGTWALVPGAQLRRAPLHAAWSQLALAPPRPHLRFAPQKIGRCLYGIRVRSVLCVDDGRGCGAHATPCGSVRGRGALRLRAGVHRCPPPPPPPSAHLCCAADNFRRGLRPLVPPQPDHVRPRGCGRGSLPKRWSSCSVLNIPSPAFAL